MCDSLVALAAATAGGSTLFAKNSDRPPAEAQVIEWSPSRTEDSTSVTYIDVDGRRGADGRPRPTVRSLLSRPAWCWGAEQGVNEAGVAIGNHTIYTTLDPRGFPPALIGMDLVRLGLERSATASEAVTVMTDLLDRHGQGGSGHDRAIVGKDKPYWSSFLVADAEQAWMLETSGATWQVERVDGSAAMSNRTCIASFDAVHRHPGQPVERLIDPRLRAGRAVLAARPVTFASIASHLRSHDSCTEAGWSVCMHVDELEATTSSMIAELPGDRPPTVWMLLGSPCRAEYVRHDF